MTAGIVLRYVDSGNWYLLQATTTALSIVRDSNGVQTTLATATISLVAGTYYRMRFRVVGQLPAILSGRTWLDGTAEPVTSPFQVTASDY